MFVVIFELDKTLISGDSNFSMGVFIHEAEIVDADDQQNDKTLDGSTFYSDS